MRYKKQKHPITVKQLFKCLVIFVTIAGKFHTIADPKKHSGQEDKINLRKIIQERTILGGLVFIPLVVINYGIQHGKFTAVIICHGRNRLKFPQRLKKLTRTRLILLFLLGASESHLSYIVEILLSRHTRA